MSRRYELACERTCSQIPISKSLVVSSERRQTIVTPRCIARLPMYFPNKSSLGSHLASRREVARLQRIFAKPSFQSHSRKLAADQAAAPIRSLQPTLALLIIA